MQRFHRILHALCALWILGAHLAAAAEESRPNLPRIPSGSVPWLSQIRPDFLNHAKLRRVGSLGVTFWRFRSAAQNSLKPAPVGLIPAPAANPDSLAFSVSGPILPNGEDPHGLLRMDGMIRYGLSSMDLRQPLETSMDLGGHLPMIGVWVPTPLLRTPFLRPMAAADSRLQLREHPDQAPLHAALSAILHPATILEVRLGATRFVHADRTHLDLGSRWTATQMISFTTGCGMAHASGTTRAALSGGIQLHHPRIQVQYAFLPQETSTGLHRFGLTLPFGTPYP